MESIKCSHVLIEEVEIRARWNAEQRRLSDHSEEKIEKMKNGTNTDYSWLVDNAFSRQATLLNACQALRLRTLSSSLRLEDTGSIIKIFRSCNQPEFRLEQLVDLMADVLMSYVDEKQRIQLLRKRDRKSTFPQRVFSLYASNNRVAPQSEASWSERQGRPRRPDVTITSYAKTVFALS